MATTPPDNIRSVDYRGEVVERIHLGPTHLAQGLVSLRMTEGELTAFAREEARRQGHTEISELQVACEPGELVASAHHVLLGIHFPVLAHLQPQATDAGVQINVSGAQVGRLPIPIDLTTYVQDGINQGLRSAGLPNVRVRRVDVERGSMTIEAEPVLA